MSNPTKKTNKEYEQEFLAAWKTAVALTGFQYFGEGTPTSCALATDKNQLRPRWDDIEPAFFTTMSEGERLFLAHVLTFFNPTLEGWPVKRFLPAIDNPSMGEASASLDPHRRAALAGLLVNYPGW